MPGIPEQFTHPFPSVSMLVLLSQTLHKCVNPEIKVFKEELETGNTLCSSLVNASGDFVSLFSLLILGAFTKINEPEWPVSTCTEVGMQGFSQSLAANE